jgi:hypothetical protein
MIDIPDKIRIGDHYYNIKRLRIIDWSNWNVSGQINYATKVMKINEKASKDERIIESTFFHEIAHGILKELEFNNPQLSKFRCNESFVEELGLTLRKTFIDLLKSQEAKNEDSKDN